MKKLSVSIAVMFVGVALFMMLGLPACRQSGEKQGEKAMEKILEESSGEKTDVDIEGQDVTIENESGTVKIHTGEDTWPANAPTDVPELKKGKIIGITTHDSEEVNNWNIRYSGVGIEALDTYAAELKSRGFKTQTMKMPKGGMVNGEKGNLVVMLTVGEGDKISVVVISEMKK